MPDVIEVLADLVAIPSVNPMGGAAEGDIYGERRVTAYCAEFLRAHGVAVELQPVGEGRANVLGRADGPQGRGSLMFETHMDTVRTEQMEIEPFDPVQVDGKLYGRGSCDAKASLAAMLVSIAGLRREGAPLDVWLCAAVDEEYTFGGAQALVDSGFRTDRAIVGEPTRLNVVTAHKGTARWRVRTLGHSAHSATPWEGSNAIYRMAPIVSALEEWAGELQARDAHPRLGPRTLSVGLISGGQTVNTVPAQCEVSVDRRVLPSEDLQVVIDSMEAFLGERGLLEGVEVEEILRDSPMELDNDSPWAQAVLAAARTVVPAEMQAVHYGTDASNLADVGIESLVLGPGDIAQAHTACEWIEVEQVRLAVEIYQEAARRAAALA